MLIKTLLNTLLKIKVECELHMDDLASCGISLSYVNV